MNNWLKYFTKEEIAGFRDAKNLYGKAYLICEKVFAGKNHSSGIPYMDHLVAVADDFSDDKAKVIALLHDIIKETEISANDLNYIGFPSDIVKAVILMTREKDESYDAFINRMINSNNNMVIQIKKSDLEKNMDINSFTDVSDDYLTKIDLKYKPQYEKILGYLGDLEKEN